MNRIRAARATLYGLAIAGTLGFGASQALAAPRAPARELSCYPECYDQCGPDLGTMLGTGRCICCDVGN
jgi:hypothetical protein